MHEHPPLLADFPPVSAEAWEEAIRADLKGADYDRTLVWHTLDGFSVKPYYRREDLQALRHAPEAVGRLRAPRPAGAAANSWALRQDIVATTVADANRLARQAAAGGATDIGFDLGLGADGFHGLPLASQHDLQALLDGIDPGTLAVHVDGGPHAAVLLAMLRRLLDERGQPMSSLRGSTGDDVLGRLARNGEADVERTLQRHAALLNELGTEASGFRFITAGAAPYHDGGASVAQETGCLLGAASEYLARLTDLGADPAAAAARMQFVVPVGGSYFVEIARLRALRLLWAQLFTAYAPGAPPMPIHIQAVTSGWNQTLYDPHVNLLRGTTEAAAAVLGGCDVLTVRPFDGAYRRPDAFSLRLARNTQLLLKHESAFDRVVDPAAGAYYVEVLTERVGEAAWAFFQEIEAAGGLVAALESGQVQARIRETRQKVDRELAARRRTLVGTNNYPNAQEQRLGDIEAPPASVTAERTGTTVAFDPDRPLASAADALARGAAIGDLVAALTAGPVVRADAIPSYRAAEPFEALRLRTERYARRQGRTPAVFLLPIGHAAMRTARATFTANFFGCAGFTILDHAGFASVDAGVEAIQRARPEIVVLCSSDEAYASYAPELCERLRTADPRPLVVVAGAPDTMETLRSAGVDDFIHRRSPLLETLRHFQERLGVEA